MSNDHVIVAEDLNKIYGRGDTKVFALHDVNVTIARGDFIAIIGPSGSGKSTFLNLLGCLDTPTSGKLLIDGLDVLNQTDDRLAKIRREKIGFIFQKYNLIPTLTALENVQLAMSFARIKIKEQIRRAETLLDMVNLSHRMNHKPSELSGGEQQRVAIARSLANNPSIILADEPTGNVDSRGGLKIMDILEEINKKGETVIIVTHDPSVAKRAKWVIQIRDGVVSGHGRG